MTPAAFCLVAVAAIFNDLMKVIADQGMADARVQQMD